ncbi:hypothetical protein BGZ83_005359 [Gryganskiella cystojenkinii]|nr:hypothetical protein BGZ83_005359 [Gryganskiella cystojenkinii]
MFWLLASGTNTSSHFLEMSGEDLGQSSNNAQRRHRDRVDGSPQSNLLAGKNLAMPVVGSDHSSSSTDNFLYPAFVPSTDEGENTVKAKDRFERVRGRGAHSDLPKIQFVFPRETDKQRSVREQRRLAVRAGFQHTWAGYKKYAWGHDEVKPVSGGFRDSFNGWGATMIDSLDTMVIMELNREFDEALEWVKTQFSMTREATVKVQFFETVIRYLGGFLSSYELTGERVLLDKAKELGGYLLNAFEDGSNYHRTFPAGRVAVAKEETSTGDTKNGYILAEIGTIQVEFTKLSKLTGDPIFEEKLPGLLPSLVQDIQNHQYESYEASMGGMIDSYYEYLLKEWILLDGEEDSEGYRSAFEQAMDSVHKYMVSTPSDGSEDYAIIGKVTTSSKSINPDMEHLACFISGTLAMSSKYFNRPQDLILAKKVAEACYQTYRRSKTGLSPESFKFRSVEGSDGKVFKVEEETFYDRDQSQKHYILRPETIESLWILYRLTGESKYQEQAWEIFQSLERSCRTNIAYSGLNDVNEGHFFDDRMESFFMAETMKYLYLMFSTPDVISLDDFVLNTEAHPVLRT